MNDHSNRWPEVAKAVAARMRAVGYLDNASLMRAAGLSEPFVRNLLAGEPRGHPRASSLAKLCRALSWSDDSIDRILAGVEPSEVMYRVELSNAEIDTVMQALRDRIDEMTAMQTELSQLRAMVLDLEKQSRHQLGTDDDRRRDEEQVAAVIAEVVAVTRDHFALAADADGKRAPKSPGRRVGRPQPAVADD